MNKYELLASIFGMAMTVSVIGTVCWAWVERGKAKAGQLPGRALAGLEQKLSRMETAIEAMAIEVERISEGQRFTTRLLADRFQEPQLRAGADPAARSHHS